MTGRLASTRRALRRGLLAALVERDSEYDAGFLAFAARVQPFTKTSHARLHGLREAVQYLVREDIPGDAVECGVWRGGSSMAIALELLDQGDDDRRLWLFDTFEGMVAPGERDEARALATYAEHARAGSRWAYAPLGEVTRNMESTAFPARRLVIVQGKVEDTIPGHVPDEIALLRLDTDLYESTRHELEHLWPRLSPGGVLIIDDYGHWRGARAAVDEFFADLGQRPLFSRLDYTGRLIVKTR